MENKELDDFLRDCPDPKLKKYLNFRYTKEYDKKCQEDREERTIETSEQRISDMENRRTQRKRPI